MPAVKASDDDLLGYELYLRDDFGSAAEVFNDTAWRGVSLYRSGQWWRAAEAFVRGNDAPTFHNLGNTYVKMGYYALALEAYQQALRVDPSFEDAEFNAQLMKQLLALREDSENGEGLLQPDTLGELEQQDDEASSSGSPDGGEKTEAADSNTKDESASGDQSTSERAVEAESGPAAHSDEDAGSESGDQGGASVTGIESDAASEQNASGNSDSQSATGKARSAGARMDLEARGW